jgi:hypothetical protein
MEVIVVGRGNEVAECHIYLISDIKPRGHFGYSMPLAVNKGNKVSIM